MEPVTEIDEAMTAYWSELDPVLAEFQPPEGMDSCAPCVALVTKPSDGTDAFVVRVPWRPDEVELAHLAHGGTVWLSTWGSLPPHMLEVAPPAGAG